MTAAIFYFPHIFINNGKSVINGYVDDLFGFDATYAETLQQQMIILTLGAILGMRWKAAKVELPRTRNIVLGICFDLAKKTVSIPDKKLQEFRELVASTRTRFVDLKTFQKIIGKMNFFAIVFRELRSFGNLGTKIVAILDKFKKKTWYWPASSEKLVQGALRDFKCAQDLLSLNQEVSLRFAANQLEEAAFRCWTDAATDRQPGCGGICSLFAWQARRSDLELALRTHNVCPAHSEVTIAHLEWVTAIFHELLLHPKVLAGKIFTFYIDNTNAESWGTKGRIANAVLTPLMQAVLIRRRALNYKVRYLRIASKDNLEADTLSEVHLEKIKFLGKVFNVLKLRPKQANKLIADLLGFLPTPVQHTPHSSRISKEHSSGKFCTHFSHHPPFSFRLQQTRTNQTRTSRPRTGRCTQSLGPPTPRHPYNNSESWDLRRYF